MKRCCRISGIGHSVLPKDSKQLWSQVLPVRVAGWLIVYGNSVCTLGIIMEEPEAVKGKGKRSLTSWQ